uniref:Cytochrome c oxidase subunit 5A, mitochondrial n=1 Tax=Corethrella appendiculata TaxID=1370023 RepID=U5EVZ7_9DIPT
MLRTAAGKFLTVFRGSIGVQTATRTLGAVRHSSHSSETDEEFDARYEAYFNRPDIDHWEARKAMNDLLGMDLVPEPKIVIAALKACRRLNDYALAIRWLEGVKDKCGPEKPTIYPYILQEIRPTLTELGIETPEELGYDVPELALKSVYDIH